MQFTLPPSCGALDNDISLQENYDINECCQSLFASLKEHLVVISTSVPLVLQAEPMQFIGANLTVVRAGAAWLYDW